MSTTIALTPTSTGIDGRTAQQQASADAINALLTRNHSDFHLFFNQIGFHNHIVHHMLAIYAMGASPAQLQRAFEENATYQRPQLPRDDSRIARLEEAEFMLSCLGKADHYHDFLVFFDRRMARDGWQAVVNEFLFSRSPVAEELLARIFAGIWHPLLVFGYGVEFEQGPVVAEALAQAASHPNPYAQFIRATEERAERKRREGKRASLVELVRAIHADPAKYRAEHWHGGTPYDEGKIAEAPDGLIELMSQWWVDGPAELDYKTAEMINVNAWIAGAAQRRSKEIKFDFVFMHQVNVSIFFSSVNKQGWISDENKIRLLEWQTRLDLLHYAAALAPELLTDEITGYVPQQARSWAAVFAAATELSDDGHVAKLIRALAHGRDVSAKYEAADASKDVAAAELPVKGDMWLQLANMAYESTSEEQGLRRWVRGANNDAAWGEFADRERK